MLKRIAALLACFAILPLAFAADGPEAKLNTAPEIESKLVVIDKGAEPRSMIRLELVPGEVQWSAQTAEIKMTFGEAEPGRQLPPLPKFEYLWSSRVGESPAPGRWKFRNRVESVRAVSGENTDVEIAKIYEESVKPLVGLSISGIISDAGAQVIDEQKADTKSPQVNQMWDSLQQAMRRMKVSIPEEPIGVGAKWITISSVKMGELQIEQRIVNRLVDFSNGTMTVRLEGKQALEKPGELTVGAVKAKYLQFDGTIEGEIVQKLSAVLPRSANITFGMMAKIELPGRPGGQSIDSTMKTTSRPATEEEIASAAAPAPKPVESGAPGKK